MKAECCEPANEVFVDFGTRLVSTDYKAFCLKIRPLNCIERRKPMFFRQRTVNALVPEQLNITIWELRNSCEESYIHTAIAYLTNVIAGSSIRHVNGNGTMALAKLYQQFPEKAGRERAEKANSKEARGSTSGASCRLHRIVEIA